MSEQEFRLRVNAVAARVAARSGVDPLSVERALAVTTDVRLERLPGSIGWGLGAMALAAGWTCFTLFTSAPSTVGPLAWSLVVITVLMGLGSIACVLIARAARARRPERDRYEDAWARFAVELWPVATAERDRSAGPYSRSEFVLAVRAGGTLSPFERHPPTTRNP